MTDYDSLKQEISDIKTSVNDMVRNVRNILTLASNYGFTGYVDISAHDQDPNAHSTNSNFVTLHDEGHRFTLGQADEIGKSYGKNQYPVEFGRNTLNRQAQDWRVETEGRNDYESGVIWEFNDVYSTNADGTKATALMKRQLFKATQLTYHTSAADPDLFAAWKVTSGSIEETSDEASKMRNKMSLLFDLTAGVRGQHKNVLELSYTSILPCVSNEMNLGSGQRVYANAYLNTAPIVLSDEREKTNIMYVPDAVLDAWGEVDWYQYQLKQAVAEKGDNARKHNGLIAQRIDTVFKKHGLDACRLGLLCHDTWDSSSEELDKDGNVIYEAVEAGDKWSVRYEEALAIEAAYQRRRADRIEHRLAALEAKMYK